MELLMYSFILATTLEVVLTAQPWWKTATFYQIYPRSFKDNNNDGIGDLKGITSKVDYLAEIGITAIWMNPINTSPMADNGYDVSDYRSIDSIFGTLDDLKELIAALHTKNIKIVLDFVPNHSSDEHPWFNRSVNREGNYTNYYVWRNASYSENGTRIVPNNWESVFRGSAWEWNEQRQQYFLHQFLVKQPDLNVRDDNVRRELKSLVLPRKICDSHWYECSKPFKKSFLIFLINTGKPVRISLKGIIHPNLETFVKSLQAAFSYLNILLILSKKYQ